MRDTLMMTMGVLLDISVPEPANEAPPGLGNAVSALMGWVRWGAIGFAVIGAVIGGGMLWVGRSQGEGSEKVSTIGRAITGGAIVAAAFTLVTTIANMAG